MQFEIDFIGVSDVTSNADAIALRWKRDNEQCYKVGVIDGGYSQHGEALCNHVRKYYKTKDIDFVVCTHPDLDHASGLRNVIQTMNVKTLYMNIPWFYIDELYSKVSDGRITQSSLEKRLREQYSCIDDLEKLAEENKVLIKPCLQGNKICNDFTVLSPSKEFYLEQLIQSTKTPLEENVKKIYSDNLLKSSLNKIENWIKAIWEKDSLLEEPVTSAENESSIILFGKLGNANGEGILLTADAGIKALNKAYEYGLHVENIDLKFDVGFYQIPHHGSRHNLNTEVMDKIVGNILQSEISIKKAEKVAYVSTCKSEEYPRKAISNAFIRRGVEVYATNGKSLCYRHGTPKREGWQNASKVEFSPQVESPDE